MKSFKQFLSESVYDYEWDDNDVGYYVTKDGKRLEFFKAVSRFDRKDADAAARKDINTLRSNDKKQDKEARENDYQFNKPLSSLEQEWVALDRRLLDLSEKELDRYISLGSIVRRSLLNHSHPVMSHRKKHA